MSMQEVVPNLSLRNRTIMERRARKARLNSGHDTTTELDIIPQYLAVRERSARLHREAEREKKLLRNARSQRALELMAKFQTDLRAWIAEAGGEPVAPVLPRKTVVEIIEAVAAFYGLDPVEVLARDRTPKITQARMVIMYLSRSYTACSLPQIGDRLKRDHTTVLYAIQTIATRLKAGDMQLHEHIEFLSRTLEGR